MDFKLPENPAEIIKKMRKDREDRNQQVCDRSDSIMASIRTNLMNEMPNLHWETLTSLYCQIGDELHRAQKAHKKDTRDFEIQCARISGEDWSGFTKPDNTPVLCSADIDDPDWDVRGIRFNHINVSNRLKAHERICSEATFHGATISMYFGSTVYGPSFRKVMYDPAKKEFHVWYEIQDLTDETTLRLRGDGNVKWEFKAVFDSSFNLLTAYIDAQPSEFMRNVESHWQTLTGSVS